MSDGKPAIYSIQRGDVPNTLKIDHVWPPPNEAGNLPAVYTHIFPFTFNKETHMCMYDKATGKADIYLVKRNKQWLNLASSQTLKKAFDIVEPFLFAAQPHALGYTAKTGEFEFFRFREDLKFSLIHKYHKAYGEDKSTDYTTVKPFSSVKSIYFLCYNYDTGKVAFYQMSVTETTLLTTKRVFLSLWERGWTKYTMFQLGGANFYLKTNTIFNTSLFDHIIDDPSQGIHVVIFYHDLLLDFDAMSPFYMGEGNPYFVTYKKSGDTTFNRIHGDCRGWTKEASLSTVTGADLVVPFRLGAENYVLFY